MKNAFIAIEGIDGSGKSTQAAILAAALRNEGLPVHLTAEPTRGPIGKMIREIFSGKMPADEHAIAALFVADRIEHLTNNHDGILKLLQEGETVITDRYYFSSYAYHGAHIDMNWVMAANSICSHMCKPHLNIFIDVSPEVAMQRIIASRDEHERYETLENLKKVRAKYLEAFKLKEKDERVLMLNGDRAPDEVAADVRRIVQELLASGVK